MNRHPVLTREHVKAVESIGLAEALEAVSVDRAHFDLPGWRARAREALAAGGADRLTEAELLEVFGAEPSEVERRAAHDVFVEARISTAIALHEGEARRRFGRRYALEALHRLPRLGVVPLPDRTTLRGLLDVALERESTDADAEHVERTARATAVEAVELARKLSRKLAAVAPESWPRPTWLEVSAPEVGLWILVAKKAARERDAEARSHPLVRLVRASFVLGVGSGSEVELDTDGEILARLEAAGCVWPTGALAAFDAVARRRPFGEGGESIACGPLPPVLEAARSGWVVALEHEAEDGGPLTLGQASARTERLAGRFHNIATYEALRISAELAQMLVTNGGES